MKLTRAALTCLLLLTATFHIMPDVAQAQNKSARSRRQVKVFFAKMTEDDSKHDPANPWNLQPVARTVDSAAPLAPTLRAFLAGPTRAEAASGLMDISYGIKLVRVRRKGSRVRADFHMPRGAAFSGDMSPVIFAEGVKKTINQFSGVRTVIVCLDGVLDFWSESDEPPKKCPRL